MSAIFGNIVTAMVTPFNAAGQVDYDEAIRLGEYLVATGTETILLAGTTGESPTLTHEEEFQLFERFVSHFKGKAKIMAGTGSNSTVTAIESTKIAESIGVDAVLQVVPYYNKPSQEGMFQHFKAVAESTSLPIMLYNIPGRTGVNMDPETTARLAEIPNIVAIKEAAGSVEQVSAIRKLANKEFQIYSGDDALTLDFMAEGASGIVSVAAHVVGKQIKEMVTLFLAGNVTAARQISDSLSALNEALFITANPAPVKYALRKKGFAVGTPRLPLVDVTTSEAALLDPLLPI